MECHYKVLGLELDADDDSIKKAYRKLALKYHPDKNPDCLDQATEKFRLVQAAYDVLSDPQERAWYDRHREEILHRKKFENYKSNSVYIFDYFTPAAYKGYGDDEKGFFSVYRDVFVKISEEDQPFASSDSEDEPMPTFGDSESVYDEVVHVFYSAWQAYSTKLSYIWENQYDVKEAPNRRVARIIEKENKKERDKHRKKRNELVRELVAFVRKRDPRVKAHRVELEKVTEEQARKAEERRTSLLKEKIERAAEYDMKNTKQREEHEEMVSRLENMMKDEFGFTSSEEEQQTPDGSSEEEDDYRDELFCVACNKTFKSEMGMRNHKKSKKHKEKVNQLQEEMRGEEEFEEETKEKSEDEMKSEVPVAKLSKKQKKQRKQHQKLLSNMMSSEPLRVSDFGDDDAAPQSVDGALVHGVHGATDDEPSPVTERNSQNECDSVVTDLDAGSLLSVGDSRADGVDSEHQTSGDVPAVDGAVAVDASCDTGATVPDGKQKKGRKARKSNAQISDANQESLNCVKCKQVFRSRNKLFQHLKQTGHSTATGSARINEIEGGRSAKRKGKKNK